MRLGSMLISATLVVGVLRSEELPTSFKEGLTIEKFAGSELIRHPTGITFTADGKLLVVESHNHFRPDQYDGPVSDQVVWLKDTDGDGVADSRSVFFGEDLIAAMDIATHPDTGAIYVATRNEILRLWDDDGDGVADPDRVERQIVFLDTEGDYPHNGCSGIAFDDLGNLIFGIGENLGEDYVLFGGRKRAATGGGEGGNIWWANADGSNLRRFATGFWNPFGICHLPGGYIFATDNDPGGRPPSRLHFVVYRGDYGFQYRYGRTGNHPFQGWDGDLPGMLPMLHGTGEAPCDVIHHEGSLYVASWADRRIEHYPLSWERGRFETEMNVIVQGGLDFRPVAFAISPDGSLYCSDWVKSDYQLHGEGAVWKIKGWQAKAREIPSPNARTQLMRAPVVEGEIPDRYWNNPWLAPAAIHTLAKRFDNDPDALLPGEEGEDLNESQRAYLLLARRASEPEDFAGLATAYLDDPSHTVKLLALKWISDEQLTASRGAVEHLANNPPSPKLFWAAITALARLDGELVSDKQIGSRIAERLKAEEVSPEVKQAAFKVLPDRGRLLKVEDLRAIFEGADEAMQLDVIVALHEHPAREAASAYLGAIKEKNAVSERVRRFAADISKVPETPQELGNRPAPGDTEGWYEWISGIDKSGWTAEAMNDHGRVVFHQRCAVCHRVGSFGRLGGPDLTSIHERGMAHLLSSILEPGAEIAPQYEPWSITLNDGTMKVGFLLGQKGDTSRFADIAGNEFAHSYREILNREQLPMSLMPPGLVNQMSDTDFVSLLRWLSDPEGAAALK
ncbi:MAG: PVC-type heme-binding CxxCH protein [Verrucomicrobiota bacterium]